MSDTQYERNKPRTVIVAGSQSISAKGVFERYASLPETTVYGLSRREGESFGHAKHISVDLLHPEDVEAKVGGLKGVTHMVFGAYLEKHTPAERSQVNTALLKNLLDVLQKSAPQLEHVTIYQGAKRMVPADCVLGIWRHDLPQWFRQRIEHGESETCRLSGLHRYRNDVPFLLSVSSEQEGHSSMNANNSSVWR